MNLSRLNWATRAQARVVIERLSDAAERWSGGWSTRSSDAHPRVAVAVDPLVQQGEWFALGVDGDHLPRAWFMTVRHPLLSICADWLGVDDGFVRAPHADCIIDQAMQHASRALLDGLCDALELGRVIETPTPAESVVLATRPWTGAVACDIRCAASHVRVVVHGEAVERLSPAARRTAASQLTQHAGGVRPVPLAKALSDVAVPASVSLRPVEITLEQLAGLSPGDVLKTTHRLDEPLQLKNAVGTPISSVSLGGAATHRCIRLNH